MTEQEWYNIRPETELLKMQIKKFEELFHWVSVDERLPEDGELVICRSGQRVPFVGSYTREYYWEDNEGFYRDVDYWALPSGRREEK